MNKSKKITLAALLIVLTLACLGTVLISRYEEKKENIKNSEETILQISYDSVTALAWEYEDTALSFHKDECWLWDEDEAFPVDEAKIADLLEQFGEFGVSFRIEDVDDYGQYGLEKPEAVISITAGESSYTVQLGNYSTLDSERYVSIGDGNVYLVKHDPLDDYALTIEDLILDDVIPDVSDATELVFAGAESYTISYEEESTKTCCAEDVYFTEEKPLDTDSVSGYLNVVKNLSTTTYVSYNATEEELAAFGLDTPELTVTVTYPVTSDEDESGEEDEGESEPVYESFTVSIGRNQEELAEARESEEEDAEEDVSAYFRVGTSQIVYQLSSSSYQKLMAASYNDLRHAELMTAPFEDVYQLDFCLEENTYVITYHIPESEETEDGDSEGGESSSDSEDSEEEEEPIWSYGTMDDISISAIQAAIEALSAAEFTDEEPSQKEEISFTVYLNNENFPEIHITLYRYDGENCIAQIDGETVALVPRSLVVDLIEAVNGIILSETAA